MLGDQWSPYVGRFARGWRRLPGRIPGQPQTRAGAHPRIGAGGRHLQRAGGHEKMNFSCAGTNKGLCAGGSSRTRREDVVDQQDPLRRTPDGTEGPRHRRTALEPGASGLGPAPRRSTEQPRERQPETTGHRAGERPGLVEPPFGEPSASERHPGHGLHRGNRAQRPDGGRQRRRHVATAGELQPVDCLPHRTGEQERRPSGRDRFGWTVAAVIGRLRSAAADAPGWRERNDGRPASVAERPRSCAAACTPTREQDVQHGVESSHGSTLPTGSDRPTEAGRPADRRHPPAG
jgi:hypothetical protein